MKFCETSQSDDVTRDSIANGGESSRMVGIYQPETTHPLMSNAVGTSKPPNSPPLPGILKARVKYEH